MSGAMWVSIGGKWIKTASGVDLPVGGVFYPVEPCNLQARDVDTGELVELRYPGGCEAPTVHPLTGEAEARTRELFDYVDRQISKAILGPDSTP